MGILLFTELESRHDVYNVIEPLFMCYGLDECTLALLRVVLACFA